MAWSFKKGETGESQKPANVTKQKVRFRLVLAFPVLTTLVVLGMGAVIVDLVQRQLANQQMAHFLQQDVYLRITNTLDQITIIIIIFAILAFVSGVAVALTVTNPIRRLAEDAAGIARGDLARNIRINADGEIALLGSAFNEMITAINRTMLQTLSGGMMIINENGGIVSMGGDAEFIFGVTADRIIGSQLTDIFPDLPENRKFLDIVNATLKERKTFPLQKLIVSTEERHEIPVAVATSLLRDKDDTFVGLSISFEDAKQLRHIEEQMRRVDRLTILGGLAASVAHQVRNPLCSIRGLAQLIQECEPGDTSLASYAGVIVRDVDRIDQVVAGLMRMLQPSNSGWALDDLNGILRETVTLAQPDISDKHIDLEESYAESLPQLSAQRENLIHAFLNIILNAAQSMGEEGGRISIRTQALASWGRPRSDAADKATGVLVEIQDNGPGIPTDVLPEVFNPGYTTKPTGTGFGLTIARQTFEAHGGEIFVKSAPGKGAMFRIWLPLRRAANIQGEALESSAGIA